MTDQNDARNLAPDLFASALVAGVSLSGPEQAFLATTSAPILMHLARRTAEELSPRIRTIRAGRALSAACDAADLTPEELSEHIAASTTNVDLADAALSGAAAARYDARIVALGNALAGGLIATDEAQIDVEQLIIKAVSELEASHVRILDIACEEADIPETLEARVTRRAPSLRPHFGPLMETLVRQHLIEIQIESTYDRTSAMRRQWGGGVNFGPERITTERHLNVTEFGRIVMQRLLDAGAESLRRPAEGGK